MPLPRMSSGGHRAEAEAAAAAPLLPPPPPPHVVAVPWPGQGHINPLMHFCTKLAYQGFTITFVNTEYNHVLLQQSSSSHEQAASLDIRFLSIPDGLPPHHTRTSDVSALCQAITHMNTAFEQLLELLIHEADPPVTCIISDIFMLHTQDAANKYDIPRVAFWTQSTASYAAHMLAANGYRPPLDRPMNEKIITCVPGAPPLRLQDMPSFLQVFDFSDFMFDFSLRPFQRINEATWVVINTFDDLEGSAVETLQKEYLRDLITIGPLLPEEYFSGSTLGTDIRAPALWPEDYDCLKWLDCRQPSSVLYVAFGSINVLCKQEIEEFALGLEATGVPLLWVLRPGLVEGGRSAVLPEGFEDRTKDRILLISWAPQLHVLSHPSVGGFLTHGGWNSTLEGMSQGHPMLGFPYFSDQMLDCRCMADLWGNGVGFEHNKEAMVNRFEVEKKVRALMEGSHVRERANELKCAAAKSVAPGGSSANNLQFIIKTIRESSRTT